MAELLLVADTVSPVRGDARTIRLVGVGCGHRVEAVIRPAADGEHWIATVRRAHDHLHEEVGGDA